MSKHNKHFLFAIPAISIVLLIFWITHNRDPNGNRTQPIADASTGASKPGGTSGQESKITKFNATRPNPVQFNSISGNNDFSRLRKNWLDAAYELQGKALLEKQKEICREAARTLIHTGLFDEFVSFLGHEGAVDYIQLLINESGTECFSGPNAERAREWFVGYGYERHAVPMAFQVGRTYKGDDFKAYMGKIPSPAIRENLLAGYCSMIALSKPEAVVPTFADLKPKNVDFSALAKVMRALPPGVDHARIATTIPEDAKTLARQARHALLENWAAVHPKDAAHYVLMNPKTVAPEQISPVLEAWLGKDFETAKAWIDDLATGPLKDQSLKSYATRLVKTDPPAAWESVKPIADLDTRIAAAKIVFEIWNNRDPEKAREEWIRVFPAQQEAKGKQ